MFRLYESVQKFILYHALVFWRAKGFWTRALLCWGIGSAVLINDDLVNFDLRLQIRGPRPASEKVVIIDVSERDWSALHSDTRNVLRPLKEIVNLNEAFFWNSQTWENLLTRVLSGDPAAVGVVFAFRDALAPSTSIRSKPFVFNDRRVIWGADVDESDHPQRGVSPNLNRHLFGRSSLGGPSFSGTSLMESGAPQFASRLLRTDDDGTVRRFTAVTSQLPHLAIRLAELTAPASTELYSSPANSEKHDGSPHNQNGLYDQDTHSTLINFNGQASSFKVVNFKDVLEGRIQQEVFRDRIIVIGSLSSPIEQMQTPLGRMSRTEITANIVDNIVEQKTVRKWSIFVYLALQTLLLASSVWLLLSYPQTVAILSYGLAAMMWAAASAWSFDIAHVWMPVLAPLIQLSLTYIIFMSHQLSLNEQTNWRLQQERKYLSEIEQLKTNFVSMMSHDLKTPIAKIQAICDRLLAAAPESEIAADLRSLRRSSDDLHRYIQSILQVTKVEAKDFKINKEVTDVNENIERVIARLLPLAQEKKINLTTNLEPMFSIEADATLLQEIVHNLVENAIKYTPPGGNIAVTSNENDDKVEVFVADNGPGIAADEQTAIWGKFTRGRLQKGDAKGSGLGLYLVKYFVELHGGRVSLSSSAEQGTRIGFSIPIAPENDEQPRSLPDPDPAERVVG